MTEHVLDFLVRSTVILSLAWAVTSLLRRASADLRHKIWLAALAGVTLSIVSLPASTPFRMEVDSRGAVAAVAAIRSIHRETIWLMLWTVGAVLVLGWHAVGLAFLARWTRQASKFDGCLMSESVATAITWGARRPVILLPGYMRSWPVDRRQMVLLHERAHIARHDWVWQTFAQFVVAIFWFQPLIWLAVARLRKEAERAADDCVLQSGASPAAYATSLIEAAHCLRGTAPRAALAMAAQATLPSRVRAILDASQMRRPANRKSQLSIFSASASLLLMLTACQSVRVYKVAEVTTPPRVVSKAEPQYTDHARTRQIAGKVALQMVIDSHGRAENIRVTQSLDQGLDANAIAAIRQWQFDPGKKDGKPVRTAATIEVNYHLR